MEIAWIGLGGNVGDVQGTLASARRALAALAEGPLRASPIYETEAWGYGADQPHLNQVVGLCPRLDAHATLSALKAIERAHGRFSAGAWGPRTLDLDLLTWPGLVIETPALTLPHPWLHLRRFVLAPWADVAPDLVVPVHGATVAELLAVCPDHAWVRRSSFS